MDSKKPKRSAFNSSTSFTILPEGVAVFLFRCGRLGNNWDGDKNETPNIVEYLVGENLVEYVAIGGEIAITHYGRKEIESALSAPDIATFSQ